MKEDLLKIINYYGVLAQTRKLSEESFELIEAIRFAEIGKGIDEKLIDHVAEEIADCYVVIEQFRQLYGISNQTIREIMEFKINRTIRGIDNENNG